MYCPYCGKDNNRVIDTRKYWSNDYTIKRIRVCFDCGRAFTTMEEIYVSGRGMNSKKMNYGYAILNTDRNSKFCKGDKFKILGYSKSANQYYVKPVEGNVNHWVDANNLDLIGGK